MRLNLHQSWENTKTLSRRDILRLGVVTACSALLSACDEKESVSEWKEKISLKKEQLKLYHKNPFTIFSRVGKILVPIHQPARNETSFFYKGKELSINDKNLYDYIESKNPDASIDIEIETLWENYYHLDSAGIKQITETCHASWFKVHFVELNSYFDI